MDSFKWLFCVSPFSIRTIIDWTFSVFTLNQSVLAEQQSFKWTLVWHITLLFLGAQHLSATWAKVMWNLFFLDRIFYQFKTSTQMPFFFFFFCFFFVFNVWYLIDGYQVDRLEKWFVKERRTKKKYPGRTRWDISISVKCNRVKRFSTSNQSRVSPDGID